MPKYYKREDIERFFKDGFPFSETEIHFSIMDILNNLDSIPTVNVLELNEDLELMLKQLGYEKVVRCKECTNRHNPKQCPYAEFDWLGETEVPSIFYCGNGEKK